MFYEPFTIREQEEVNKRESHSRIMNIRAARLLCITEFGKYAPSIEQGIMGRIVLTPSSAAEHTIRAPL